jgi:hypothetical protein
MANNPVTLTFEGARELGRWFLLVVEDPCEKCPEGIALVVACSRCGDELEKCDCELSSWRRSQGFEPDTYDPDINSMLWSPEHAVDQG